VSLFNYNPSIAGGKIGVKRFTKCFPKGQIMRRNAQAAKTAVIGAETGTGLTNPGHHIGGLMGAAPQSSKHGDNAAKKRVFEAISQHLGGSKRHRA